MLVISPFSGFPGGLFLSCHSGSGSWTSSEKHHHKYIFFLLAGAVVLFHSWFFSSSPNPALALFQGGEPTSLMQRPPVSSILSIGPAAPVRFDSPSTKAEDMLDCRHLDLAGVTSWVCDHPEPIHTFHSMLSSSELPGILRVFFCAVAGYVIRYPGEFKGIPVPVVPPPPKRGLGVRFAFESH